MLSHLLAALYKQYLYGLFAYLINKTHKNWLDNVASSSDAFAKIGQAICAILT